MIELPNPVLPQALKVHLLHPRAISHKLKQARRFANRSAEKVEHQHAVWSLLDGSVHVRTSRVVLHTAALLHMLQSLKLWDKQVNTSYFEHLLRCHVDLSFNTAYLVGFDMLQHAEHLGLLQ